VLPRTLPPVNSFSYPQNSVQAAMLARFSFSRAPIVSLSFHSCSLCDKSLASQCLESMSAGWFPPKTWVKTIFPFAMIHLHGGTTTRYVVCVSRVSGSSHVDNRVMITKHRTLLIAHLNAQISQRSSAKVNELFNASTC
jgi:hypothetical protein